MMIHNKVCSVCSTNPKHETLHQALDSFSAQLNDFPRAAHEEDHEMILQLAQGFNKEVLFMTWLFDIVQNLLNV